jgi:HEAT repeat protein
LVDPNVVSPQLIEFLAGMATGYLTKEGENILEKSTNRIFESLKKKLGKDEFEKIKGMETPEAKKALESLIKKKHLRKEVHAFYVIYKYLEKFTEDSQFLRVMDFRRGEGIPLDRMYVKLQIIEEQKKKEQLVTSKYYDEDYYYQAKEKWMRSEEHSRKINPDEIMALDKGIVCILGLPGAGKTTLCKYFCWKTLKGDYLRQRFPVYIELRGIEKDEDPVTYALHSKLREHFTKEEIEEAVATIKHNTDIFSPLYIFDGLDEVKIEYGKISESIRNCADCSLCIVTSRRSGFIYLQHDKTYEILSLGPDEKEEFVRNYFTQIEEDEKIESFLHVLEKKEYDSLSKNPLLLSILCALASDIEDVKTLPSRRSGLYRKIVGKMNEWHKSKGGEGLSQEEIRVLEDLALSLFLKKRPKILFDERDIDEKILKKAKEVGLIYKWDELRYSFLHLTFQEYFAAYSLGSLKKGWKGIVREKKDIVSWHEIFQLFASILSEEEKYKELKEFFSIILESADILYLNYALAGHCLAEIDMDDVDWSDEILGRVFHEFEEGLCRKFPQESVVHLGNRVIGPLLDKLSGSNNVDTKRDIIWCLGEIGEPAAVDPLINLLEKTSDESLRESIAWSLGKIRDCRAADPLIRLLKETDNDYLKIGISWALGKIGNLRAINSLMNILEVTDNFDLKECILWAISELGDKNLEVLINLLEQIDDASLRKKISISLARMGEKAVTPLISFLEKTDFDCVKIGISLSLGEIRDPRAVDPLIKLLIETDAEDLKETIVWSLGEIRDPRAVDPLINLLEKTGDESLRESIAWSLGKIRDCRAVNPLMDILAETSNDYLKKNIVWSLGEIRDPKAVRSLIDSLEKTDNDELRMVICNSLRKMEEDVVRPLMDLLERTTSNDLRKRIVWALGLLKDSRAVDVLIDLLKETDNDDLKKRIMRALARIGDLRAVEPLIDLLEGTRNESLRTSILASQRYFGDKIASSLIDLLIRAEDSLKMGIVRCLGEIREPRAIDVLIDLLKETDNDDLKKGIVWALARTGDPRAVEPLIDLLKETDNDDLKKGIVWALARTGDPRAVEPLIDLLVETDNDDLRERIVWALARTGDPRAVEPLIDLLDTSTENRIRSWISYALGSIGDPRGIDPLIELCMKTYDDNRRTIFLGSLRKFNPIYLFPFLKEKESEDIVLNVLCEFSAEFNIRFFKDKIVLPEGDVLHIKAEAQREQAIKKLDKILKKKK